MILIEKVLIPPGMKELFSGFGSCRNGVAEARLEKIKIEKTKIASEIFI
ncbi:MAG: hypothetical protein KQA38_02555 [Candidatus Aenigmarchaeota archaeon]|nr:hypothetical protein [Candidatus Aenigmarchaeota archaeon]